LTRIVVEVYMRLFQNIIPHF